jgi:feruloyl esterase
VQKTLLSKPQGYIAPPLLEAIDARVVARCDAVDGAKDGLVQDPSRCPMKPESLQCKAGETGSCLTADQLAVFKAYVEPLRDRRGRVAYPGWPMAHLAGPTGAAGITFGRTASNPAAPQAPWGEERNAPRSWRLALESLTMWLGYGPSATLADADIDVAKKSAGDELFARTRSIMGAGEGWQASKLLPFFAKGGKLILYHGTSDPSITPVRSTMMYEDLITAMKGLAKAQQSARYFLVPGMHHCSNGAGVDQFDTLSALEAWVEKGSAPALIAASSRPDAPVKRTLPLCAYPQQARYSGKGDVNDAANWSCRAVRR